MGYFLKLTSDMRVPCIIMMLKVSFRILITFFPDDMFISFYSRHPSTVVLGARAQLICSTAATTLPYFIRMNRGEEELIYKQKNELKEDYLNGKVRGWVEFEIQEVRLEDSGNYTCEARWHTDKHTAVYKLEVFGKSLPL